MEKNTKTKAPQSKKLTTLEKALLLAIVNTVKEEYQERLENKEIDEMFKQLLTEQLDKFNELERKLT